MHMQGPQPGPHAVHCQCARLLFDLQTQTLNPVAVLVVLLDTSLQRIALPTLQAQSGRSAENSMCPMHLLQMHWCQVTERCPALQASTC